LQLHYFPCGLGFLAHYVGSLQSKTYSSVGFSYNPVIGSHAFDAVELIAQNMLSMRVDHVICCNLLLCLQEGDLTAQEKLLVGIPICNKNKTISEKISRNIFKLIWAQ
jgi:hypothetical protein